MPVAGRHLLQSLTQMRNRGNGKGGGIAAAGLDPAFFGTTLEVIENDYLLAVALLDQGAAAAVERDFVEPLFEVDHALTLPALPDPTALGLEVPPPAVRCWFVRVRSDVRERFLREHQVAPADAHRVDDEIVYQNTYRLNRALYASLGEKRAFVLSHGKNLLVLKLVGYGDDVVRTYRLEDLHAHVWIGHHRYPTKGRVWHPGGAHPFLGMHEALVHNGDFANYASIASY
ncbi:MAG: glutamate synthase, partial [Thermoanaerobaculia bacterium]